MGPAGAYRMFSGTSSLFDQGGDRGRVGQARDEHAVRPRLPICVEASYGFRLPAAEPVRVGAGVDEQVRYGRLHRRDLRCVQGGGGERAVGPAVFEVDADRSGGRQLAG